VGCGHRDIELLGGRIAGSFILAAPSEILPRKLNIGSIRRSHQHIKVVYAPKSPEENVTFL
jgi:hypothetical protein